MGKKKIQYWYCQGDGIDKCGRMLMTNKITVRRRCDCQMFMVELTKEEFKKKRLERTGNLLAAAGRI